MVEEGYITINDFKRNVVEHVKKALASVRDVQKKSDNLKDDNDLRQVKHELYEIAKHMGCKEEETKEW